MRFFQNYLFVIGLSLAATQLAGAQTCPTLSTLTNGTTADANVVMGNFNGVANCVNNSIVGITSVVGGKVSVPGVQFPDGTIQTTAAGTSRTPTHQIFLSGSGTYTTPANARWIEIALVGGGGGGGAGGQSAAAANGGNTCWNTSGVACTNPVYQAGGGAGATWVFGASGGAVSGSSICDWSAGGGGGGGGNTNAPSSFAPGGVGGNTSLGGGGATADNSAGSSAAANTGAGGGGGGGGSTQTNTGGGGGGGATCHVVIGSPASTYTYAVGAGGLGNASPGSGGYAGGNGAAGQIIIYEHYGS